jgi:hypothetical protein
VAISNHAIIAADVSNPAGGFTDEEYRSFAQAFDNIAYPVNVENFGRPTDIDRNGKVIVFYTRAVNALTPEGSPTGVTGGFFANRDLFPRDSIPAQRYEGCQGSNEAEMFYMLVPDPNGTVNNNVRTKASVERGTIATITHELQHLINLGRRIYENAAATDEEVWLNEGLSHIAEELAFYRLSSLGPRQNLGPNRTLAGATREIFLRYQWQNHARLSSYLHNPEGNSPYDADDDLATRGAIWQFLRYAADRRGGTESAFWMALVNSRTAGLANLRNVLGTDPAPWFRDWAVSVYTDDAVPEVEDRYVQPSWDYRRIQADPILGQFNNGSFPLRTRQLVNGTPTSFSLTNRGGTAFLRFGVAANGRAEIRTTSGGATPPAHLFVSVVRTR